MWTLDRSCVPPAERLCADTPLALLAVLGVGAGVVAGLVELGALPVYAGRVAGVTAAHGALLATALAWSRAGVLSCGVAVALVGRHAGLALAGSGRRAGGRRALEPLAGVGLQDARRSRARRPRPRRARRVRVRCRRQRARQRVFLSGRAVQ